MPVGTFNTFNISLIIIFLTTNLFLCISLPHASDISSFSTISDFKILSKKLDGFAGYYIDNDGVLCIRRKSKQIHKKNTAKAETDPWNMDSLKKKSKHLKNPTGGNP